LPSPVRPCHGVTSGRTALDSRTSLFPNRLTLRMDEMKERISAVLSPHLVLAPPDHPIRARQSGTTVPLRSAAHGDRLRAARPRCALVPVAPRRHPCPARDAPKRFELGAFELIANQRSIGGSLVGGLAETREMLDFCAKCGIVADVETIPMQDVNRAYERMLKSDVRYRFSIDLASLR